MYPFLQDLQSFSPTTTIITTVSPKNYMFASSLLLSKSASPQSTAHIDSSVKNATLTEQTKSIRATTSILTLLESFGHSQKHREVEVGRDRIVNILGMPIGRKDGISLAPLRGLSVGNEDMFGPIAINDKYNIYWGFFNDLSKMLSKAVQ
ncbi:hypothetical protein LOAG_06606 [Loa loa]|uniref:Uncharacterized protein n=1 Tax=Loa loa TaxID=7209 RepID=A0A1S0TZ44_LOALO|nr:hypothetical protein LOAG_06606 [Loa loa]EFO21880.1 hypothetical protein LOAG_06606 [Loa loa]